MERFFKGSGYSRLRLFRVRFVRGYVFQGSGFFRVQFLRGRVFKWYGFKGALCLVQAFQWPCFSGVKFVSGQVFQVIFCNGLGFSVL